MWRSLFLTSGVEPSQRGAPTRLHAMDERWIRFGKLESAWRRVTRVGVDEVRRRFGRVLEFP